MHRDLTTERTPLVEYWQWCESMVEVEAGRAEFHCGLFSELVLDHEPVGKEYEDKMGPQPRDNGNLGNALTVSFRMNTEHKKTTGHLGLRLSSLPPLPLLGPGIRTLP